MEKAIDVFHFTCLQLYRLESTHYCQSICNYWTFFCAEQTTLFVNQGTHHTRIEIHSVSH